MKLEPIRRALAAVALGMPVLLATQSVSARQALAGATPASCSSLTLHLSPGLHPPGGTYRMTPAPDSPTTPFTVDVPLYPNMTVLQHDVGSPFFSVSSDPYLQTASAEFRAPATSQTVLAWYRKAMPGCGWKASAYWDGNAGTFPMGIGFERGRRGMTEVDISFEDVSADLVYVAVAAQAIRYPAPPASARIHGPFVRLRITIAKDAWVSPKPNRPPVHTTVEDHQEIAGLVDAIDDINRAFTVPGICVGGSISPSHAQLTFVRADGSQAQVVEEQPGECQGIEVNGFRWLVDPGTVWPRIQRLAKHAGQRGSASRRRSDTALRTKGDPA